MNLAGVRADTYVEQTEEPRPWVEHAAIMRRVMGEPLPCDGPGPWWLEPDLCQWLDAETGYPCRARRQHYGVWCGYVAVPATHLLHGADYGVVDDLIDVHGGITFAGSLLDAGDWWIGFDCGHPWDLLPAMTPLGESTYRTLDYVAGELAGLARQLWERDSR